MKHWEKKEISAALTDCNYIIKEDFLPPKKIGLTYGLVIFGFKIMHWICYIAFLF